MQAFPSPEESRAAARRQKPTGFDEFRRFSSVADENRISSHTKKPAPDEKQAFLVRFGLPPASVQRSSFFYAAFLV
jgi:hypothetical protein